MLASWLSLLAIDPRPIGQEATQQEALLGVAPENLVRTLDLAATTRFRAPRLGIEEPQQAFAAQATSRAAAGAGAAGTAATIASGTAATNSRSVSLTRDFMKSTSGIRFGSAISPR